MKLTKGLSFSLKRAIDITGIKQSIAQRTGIPTTKSGLERKIKSNLIRILILTFLSCIQGID